MGGARAQGRIVLATVKGDVHDIGKNIVGVVLGCNNYDVIDLGVMVTQDRILQAAIDHDADLVGLSGLITPSLDEMVSVAREMQRRRLALPLLIGGATTSRQHTAVKIAPEYGQPVVHVLDASRAVDVVSSLLSDARRPAFSAANRDEQARLREQHGRRAEKPLLTLAQARQNRLRIDVGERGSARAGVPRRPHPRSARPRGAGAIHRLDVLLHGVAAQGACAGHLRTPAVRDGRARALRSRAGAAGAHRAGAAPDGLRASTVSGPRRRTATISCCFATQARSRELLRFCMLRQQDVLADDKPNRCLADFVAPIGGGRDDYVGAFAVTAGLGADALVAEFERDHDDYHAIMTKALADRLAEAFAEYLHARARADWGYGTGERLGMDELVAEKYRGIRPAFGYPACPDHSEKRKLFDLLHASDVGLSLTESCAMLPAASVSGLYLASPRARYFAVGRLGPDQIADYARRKGIAVDEAEKWLGPNLAYETSVVG